VTNGTYIELCAGLGGTRAGLDAAGWVCNLALDNDPDVAAAHREAFGDCIQLDVRDLAVADVPSHDLLVSGFPCQPFSSSGLRNGFSHEKGHVFEKVAHICAIRKPTAVLLENVRGLLSNAYGHTFASVLSTLTGLDYVVSWGVLDSAWFGVPQSRPRIFIVATRRDIGATVGVSSNDEVPPVNAALGEYLAPFGRPRVVDLGGVIEERRPRPGLRRPVPQTPFGVLGTATSETCWTWDKAIPVSRLNGTALGDVVCPNFEFKEQVRSVRYWGHSGVTKPYFKSDPIAHCQGTNIGAGPTFGIEKRKLRTARARAALLEYANWVREEQDHLIFRIVPSRAALLFGPHMESLQRVLATQSVGVTKQYEMIGNLVVPEVARRLGVSLNQQLFAAVSGNV
jgi:site-specific DNA-cytosine methylase